MINVLFAADFPIEKSGIASTASSILSEVVLGPTCLFSELPLYINGSPVLPAADLRRSPVDLIFTHTEYSGLPALKDRYPQAIVHVGDWPLRHWKSVCQFRPIKGLLATLRCKWRLHHLDLTTRLAFVTQEDCASATEHGFIRALHLPIGVRPPKNSLAEHVDFKSVCFSGNFRYPPNRDAAQRLLLLARSQFPELRIFLVGFYANDFKELAGKNVELHADVPSVVDFLAERRPIYVSLINSGAGAKNKILEALVSGCPIICTPESLDSSIPSAPSIKIATSNNEVAIQLEKWSSSNRSQALTQESNILAEDIRARRSWRAVASMVRDAIDTNPK